MFFKVWFLTVSFSCLVKMFYKLNVVAGRVWVWGCGGGAVGEGGQRTPDF